MAAYRQAAVDVCHRLRLRPVYMEEFDPQRPTPEQVCQREVQSCDVFVLLLAHRYGARPPGGQLSYTELEYRWAINRPEMPLLAFVADPAFPWPPLDVDRGADAEALARFVANVKAQHEIKPLADVGAYHRFDPSKVRDEEAEAGKRSLIEPNADEIVRKLTAAGPSKMLISTRLMPLALEGRFGRQMPGVRRLRLPGLTDADTRTLLGRLEVRGSEPAIAGFFGPLGNHPLLAGVVASLVRDYRAAPGDFDRWLADPTAGGALTVPGLDLTQRRTHILAAALSGPEPGPRRLLGWISVLAGSVAREHRPDPGQRSGPRPLRGPPARRPGPGVQRGRPHPDHHHLPCPDRRRSRRRSQLPMVRLQ